MPGMKKLVIDNGEDFKLSTFDPDYTGKLLSKDEAAADLSKNIEHIIELQEKLYASDHYSLLLVFQAMDTAGKDGTIKHVMSGLNPQGTQVHSFKQPSTEELNHDYLWRASKSLPERGQIGIFNRSYYEEVLVVRVHQLIKSQRLPETCLEDVWKNRFRQIRDFERYLFENGIIPVKFFLHISKEEQKKRLLERIEDASKNWKFSEADIKERAYWDEYQESYQDAIRETATSYAPWHIIPANKKWFARLTVSRIIVKTLKDLKLEYPKIDDEQQQVLAKCQEKLLAE